MITDIKIGKYGNVYELDDKGNFYKDRIFQRNLKLEIELIEIKLWWERQVAAMFTGESGVS